MSDPIKPVPPPDKRHLAKRFPGLYVDRPAAYMPTLGEVISQVLTSRGVNDLGVAADLTETLNSCLDANPPLWPRKQVAPAMGQRAPEPLPAIPAVAPESGDWKLVNKEWVYVKS